MMLIWQKIKYIYLLLIIPIVATAEFHVIGYFPTWDGSADEIQYSKLTCINYSFILPSNGSGGITDLSEPDRLIDLVSQAHAAGVKVCIAVGGWNDGDDSNFEAMASGASARTTFIKNLITFAREYDLDGVDIDWEYPDQGSSANNYEALMKELADSLHNGGKILSAAVIGRGDYYGLGINTEVFSYVDYLNIMSYDHDGTNHSSWDDAVDDLDYWLNRGLPKEKAVLGVPFYGRGGSQYIAYADLVDQDPQAPYKNNVGNVYYNGIALIKQKTEHVLEQGGGIMIWELSQDTHDETSLLSAIHEVVSPTNVAPVTLDQKNNPHLSVTRGIIHLTLHKGDNIGLALYNCSGREIETVARGFFTAGRYVFPIGDFKAASGVYFISLTGSSQKIQKKVVPMR